MFEATDQKEKTEFESSLLRSRKVTFDVQLFPLTEISIRESLSLVSEESDNSTYETLETDGFFIEMCSRKDLWEREKWNDATVPDEIYSSESSSDCGSINYNCNEYSIFNCFDRFLGFIEEGIFHRDCA